MRKTLLALAILGSSTAAIADPLFYAGISAGRSDFEGNDKTNYGIYAGTGLLPLLDLEAGYVEQGKFAMTGGNVKISSLYAAVRPGIHVGNMHVYAKAGVHSWSSNTDRSVTDFKKNDSSVDVMYGVGVEFDVFGPFALGVNYTNYRINSENLGTYNATLSFNFL